MMRRTGFKRPERAPRAPMVLTARPPAPNVRMASGLAMASPVPAPKEPEPLRDESYRRLVATLPCIFCTLVGDSQAAHENHGKAKGRKKDDRRTFPLCTVSGNGCHEAFDQYRLVPGGRDAHIALGIRYVESTQATLRRMAREGATGPNAALIIERVLS